MAARGRMVRDIFKKQLCWVPMTQSVILYILNFPLKKDAEAFKMADFEAGELGPPP